MYYAVASFLGPSDLLRKFMSSITVKPSPPYGEYSDPKSESVHNGIMKQTCDAIQIKSHSKLAYKIEAFRPDALSFK